jgi:ABC-2 type transport system permease protein
MTSPLDQPTTLLGAWRHTLQAIGRDAGVWMILALAPVIYGFFYPWPYMDQAVTRVPVAVVDLDHSSLSRQITRFAAANPKIDVRWVTGNEQEAQQALWRGEIEGYAVLPRELKRQVVRGASAVVAVEGNGAYALLNKAVLYGFAEAVGTVSAGVEIKKLQARGQPLAQAQAGRSPVNTRLVPLFNTTEGYGSYVVPAVAWLIVQQTLLMGAAMLVGTWCEAGVAGADLRVWLGRILGLSTVGWCSALFFLGWDFVWQGYPRGASPWAGLGLAMLYVPVVVSLGCVLGLWFKDRERALQALLFAALPAAFLSGFSWPSQALPEVLQWLRWLLPSTSGIQGGLKLHQMGATWADVAPQWLALGLMGTACVGGLMWLSEPAPATRAPNDLPA